MEEPNDKVTNEFVVAVVTAANDSDLEALKMATVLFLSGVGVEQSTLEAVRYAVDCMDESVATLTKRSRWGPAWELGRILEGSDGSMALRGSTRRQDERGMWRGCGGGGGGRCSKTMILLVILENEWRC
jgi:hypothetical protein